MTTIKTVKRAASAPKTLRLTSPAKSRNVKRAALASVAPVATIAPSVDVVDLDAKRSAAAIKAAATRRANVELKRAADERAATEAHKSEIAKRAAATRNANRENGIAPRRAAQTSVPADRSNAAVRANRTRLVAKIAATNDENVKRELNAKLIAFDAKHSAPAVTVAASSAIVATPKKRSLFSRFFASFL